jgi:hypothetical protein
MPTPTPAICFIDLSGYTALTEDIGDQAAAGSSRQLVTLKLAWPRRDAGVPLNASQACLVSWVAGRTRSRRADPRS